MTSIPKYLLNKKQTPILFTKAGFDKIVSEKKTLEAERPDAVEHLKKAREMGDLSENGYYKASRQRLSFIDARLRRLSDILKRAAIVQSAKTGVVDIGSTVTLRTKQIEVTYTIVGGYESNPSEKTISYRSPLGSALMGKKAGETAYVTAPLGSATYIIQSVS